MRSFESSARTSAGEASAAAVLAAPPPPQWFGKFEQKCPRVKGVSFHPSRPWLAACLHNGLIQIWDYKLGIKVDTLEDHEGPVRSVSFHDRQPLLASAGDDYKVRLWNYKQKKIVYTFEGHSDYVRSVVFHHDFPWLMTASDDQTVRIWNWQSRACIAVLTGHTHYIMCATFHPSEPIVATCSLDQTVRIWDISHLIERHSAKKTAATSPIEQERAANQDFFGPLDVVIKHVIEGHDRGVNWVAFHPTKPLLLSCSDDRLIKVWRMNDTRFWELESFRGHFNNVSCAMFHPRYDWIVSCGEDRTIRVWDLAKKSLIFTTKRENDRFWFVTAALNSNLMAVGHDGGFIVFKLEKERPLYCAAAEDGCYLLRDKTIRFVSLTGRETSIGSIASSSNSARSIPTSLTFSTVRTAFLVQYAGGVDAEMFFSQPISGSSKSPALSSIKIPYPQAVWLPDGTIIGFDRALNRFCHFQFCDGTCTPLSEPVEYPFKIKDIVACADKSATNCMIIITSAKVVVYDMSRSENLFEIEVSSYSHYKRCSWSHDGQHLAITFKRSMLIVDRNLVLKFAFAETLPIKSEFWHKDVLFYATANHIKFCLLNGDSGIIKTIDCLSFYICGVKDANVYCFDRAKKLVPHHFEKSEIILKKALMVKDYAAVHEIISNCNLVGQALIAYLRKKGYPEIALSFVRDAPSRFELALECGNLDVALESARSINLPDVWSSLATEALKQGQFSVAELCYQKTNQLDKLAVLYCCSGETEKLVKLSQIAFAANNFTLSFLCNSYLGGKPIQNNASLLSAAKLPALQYLSLKSSGEYASTNAAASLLKSCNIHPEEVDDFPCEKPTAFEVSPNIDNWPVKPSEESSLDIFFDARVPDKSTGRDELVSDAKFDIANTAGEKSESLAFVNISNSSVNLLHADTEPAEQDAHLYEEDANGWDDAIVDLDESEDPFEEGTPLMVDDTDATLFDALQSGAENESILRILDAQFGIKQFHPLANLFEEFRSHQQNPALKSELEEVMKKAFELTTAGKFVESRNAFQNALYRSFFVDNVEYTSEAMKYLRKTCINYIFGLAIELCRKENVSNLQRNLELSVYFTYAKLQMKHVILTLRAALSLHFKQKNFKTCLALSTRLLEAVELEENENESYTAAASIREQTQKISAACNRNPVDAIDIEYDPNAEFEICSVSFKPIYDLSDAYRCSFCHSITKSCYSQEECTVCSLGTYSQNA